MDGYALIEINTEGKLRVKENDGSMELHYFDFRLKELDLDGDFICDCIETYLEGLKDCLVMVLFTYQSVTSGGGDYWSIEYEDNIIYQSHTIVKQNYKEFYRMLVAEELKVKDYGYPDEQYYKDLVAWWEEFYDKDFEPPKKKRKNIINL